MSALSRLANKNENTEQETVKDNFDSKWQYGRETASNIAANNNCMSLCVCTTELDEGVRKLDAMQKANTNCTIDAVFKSLTDFPETCKGNLAVSLAGLAACFQNKFDADRLIEVLPLSIYYFNVRDCYTVIGFEASNVVKDFVNSMAENKKDFVRSITLYSTDGSTIMHRGEDNGIALSDYMNTVRRQMPENSVLAGFMYNEEFSIERIGFLSRCINTENESDTPNDVLCAHYGKEFEDPVANQVKSRNMYSLWAVSIGEVPVHCTITWNDYMAKFSMVEYVSMTDEGKQYVVVAVEGADSDEVHVMADMIYKESKSCVAFNVM